MKPSQVNPPEADKPAGSHKRKVYPPFAWRAKIPIFYLNSSRAAQLRRNLYYVSISCVGFKFKVTL
jgi:hypothetical protein